MPLARRWVMKEFLQQFSFYNSWANALLKDVIIKLPEEKQQQHIPSSLAVCIKQFCIYGMQKAFGGSDWNCRNALLFQVKVLQEMRMMHFMGYYFKINNELILLQMHRSASCSTSSFIEIQKRNNLNNLFFKCYSMYLIMALITVDS